MKPKKWPYSGQKKKQPENQIAELKSLIAVNTSDIVHLRNTLYSTNQLVKTDFSKGLIIFKGDDGSITRC